MSENENQQVQPEPNHSGADESSTYRVVPAANGIIWLKQAAKLFFARPGTWLGMTFILLMALLILMSIPIIKVLSFIITPVFIGGIMSGCHQLKTKNNLQINHLFSGFNQSFNQLLVVGFIYLVAVAIVFFLTHLILNYMGHVIYTPNLENLLKDPEEYQRYAQSLLLPMLIMMLFLIPVYMGLWFSPALVILREEKPLNAIKKSFAACALNTIPFLIYGMVAFSGIIVLTIPLALLANLIPSFSIFFFILYNLSLFSVLVASQFTSFEDIFPHYEATQHSVLEENSLIL